MSRSDRHILTHTGRLVDPFDLRPEDIHLADIAHALSRQCRWSGHTRVFYSVAEHSIRVAGACPQADRLWALLHDASEAYLIDLPRPIKNAPGMEEYRAAEARAMRAICDAFGLPHEMPASVRAADDVLLATEARDLLRTPAGFVIDADPLPSRIEPLSDRAARLAFEVSLTMALEDRLAGVTGEVAPTMIAGGA